MTKKMMFMPKVIRVLSIVLILLSMNSFGQEVYPPPPDDAYMTHETNPCTGDPLEHDPTVLTPPPGLCLPINDYIYPLLVLGILYGAYRMHKLERA